MFMIWGLIWNITLSAVWAAIAVSGRHGSMRDILNGEKKGRGSNPLSWHENKDGCVRPFLGSFSPRWRPSGLSWKPRPGFKCVPAVLACTEGFFFVADVQKCGVLGIEQQRGQASTNFLIFRLRTMQPFYWRFPLTFDPGVGLSWPRWIHFEFELSVKEQSWDGRRRKPRGYIWRAHGCGRLRRSLLTLTGWRH